MRILRYDWAGAAVGLALPVAATLIAAWDRHGGVSAGALAAVQGAEPLLWFIDAAPLALGALGWAIERQRRVLSGQQTRIAQLELQRRISFERTASELSGTALTLLADVSSLGTASSRMTASVRGTIEAMTALSHGATAAALAAETVAGRALDAASSPDASAADLKATLRGAAGSAKEIARIAQEQMGGIDQVLCAMNDIHFATEASAASAREIATEARALAQHARALRTGLGGPDERDDRSEVAAVNEPDPRPAAGQMPDLDGEWGAAPEERPASCAG